MVIVRDSGEATGRILWCLLIFTFSFDFAARSSGAAVVSASKVWEEVQGIDLESNALVI